jgi:hypothetical protein
VADQRVHGTTHELPSQRFARAEAAALTAVDTRPPAQQRLETRIVPRDGLVAVEANLYPVPLSWAGHTSQPGCGFTEGHQEVPAALVESPGGSSRLAA